jgi:GNAT superfamily N-acetyltransferase
MYCAHGGWPASFSVERVTGIEPAWPAWKAGALPLSYTRAHVRLARSGSHSRRPWCHGGGCDVNTGGRVCDDRAMAVSVRTPDLHDVDELARINIDTWRAAYGGIVPQARLDRMDMETYRQRWLETVSGARSGVACFVADIDGRPVGYAVGGPYRPQENAGPEDVTGLGELYAIYVDPARQRYGAGSAVHEVLLRWLREQGYVEAALWVLVSNTAGRRWYERRGWREDGALTLWSAGDRELPELRMRRGLDHRSSSVPV